LPILGLSFLDNLLLLGMDDTSVRKMDMQFLGSELTLHVTQARSGHESPSWNQQDASRRESHPSGSAADPDAKLCERNSWNRTPKTLHESILRGSRQAGFPHKTDLTKSFINDT
jgi:hypothetical protein